jgi:putative ABC transport system ATP-binding protein
MDTQIPQVQTQPSIVASGISKQVLSPTGPLDILDDVSLRIEKGRSAAIVGASGSGKSTLLGLLAGLDLPTRGHVELLGTRLDTLSEDQRASLRLRAVGFVFQNFQLLPNLTALENVALPLELRGERRPNAAALEWLRRVGLSDRAQHLPLKLSGGEQQRVAIARAFVGNPQVLFADEPTGNLDHSTGAQIADLLFTLSRDQGGTLVLVTHDLKLAERCDERIEIAAGRLQQRALA